MKYDVISDQYGGKIHQISETSSCTVSCTGWRLAEQPSESAASRRGIIDAESDNATAGALRLTVPVSCRAGDVANCDSRGPHTADSSVE